MSRIMYPSKTIRRGVFVLIWSIDSILGSSNNSTYIALKSDPALINAGDLFSIELFTNSSRTHTFDTYSIVLSTSKPNELPRNILVNYNSSSSQRETGIFVFSATVQTVLAPGSTALDSSYLNVNYGDVIILSFIDSLLATVQIRADVQIVAPQLVLIGQPLFFNVIDPFSSGPASMIGSINVSVSVVCINSAKGANIANPIQATEFVTLFETSPDSHNFTGSLSTIDRLSSNSMHLLSGDGTVVLQGQTSVAAAGCFGDALVISYENRIATVQADYAPKLVVYPLMVIATRLTPLQITVFQRNLSNLLNLSVLVTSTRFDEPEEIVQLYPTPPKNGTFTGSIFLGNSSAFPLQGDNFVRTFPGDNVEVTYYSSFGLPFTGLVRVSTTGTLKLSPTLDQAPLNSNVASILPGGAVLVTVTDQIVQSSVTVNVSSSSFALPISLLLQPTGNVASNVFTGTLVSPSPTSTAPMTVTYIDTMSELGSSVTVSAVAKVAFEGLLSCLSSQGSTTFAENATLYITVVDSDMDQSTLVPDSTFDLYRSDFLNQSSATVTAAGPADTEVIKLMETGASTGVFTGAVSTTTDPTSHNGSIYAASPGTLVTLSYFDQFPQIIRQGFLRLCSVGSVYVNPYNALAGQAMQIMVVDPDLNTNAYAVDSASVTITDAANKSRTLTLYEQGLNVGNFTGSVVFTTSLAASNVSTIYDTPGTLITVVYYEQAPLGNRTPQFYPRLGTVGTLSAGPSIVNAQSLISITVVDQDLNTNSLKVEQYAQLVRIQMPSVSAAFSYIGLTETSLSSATFTGSFNASAGVGSSANQIPLLQGLQADPVIVTYFDQTYGTVPPTALLRPSSVGTVSVSQLSCNTGQFNIGESLTIDVQDSDAGANMSVSDTVSVLVKSSGFARNLSLLETGPVTGEFTGVFSTALTYNGISLAPIHPLDVISAVYTDVSPVTSATYTSTAHLYATISTTPQYLLSTTLSLAITVVDSELNLGDLDSSPLTYRFGSNSVPLPITENAPNSSIFTAVLMLPRPLPTCSNRYCTLFLLYTKGLDLEASTTQLTLLVGTDGGDGFGDGPILSTVALPNRQTTCPTSLNFGGTCGPSLTACADNTICGNVVAALASLSASSALTAPAGSAVTVTVIDLDQDTNPYSFNSVPVTVQNLKNLIALDTYILQENDLQSGTFTGMFLIDNDRNSSNVTSSPGDILEVIYSDQPTSNSTNAVLRKRLVSVVVGGQLGLIYLQSTLKSYSINTSSIFAGDRLLLQLYDSDLNMNPVIAEVVNVSVQSVDADGRLKSAVPLNIILTETNVSSGVFGGVLQTVMELYTCNPLLFTSADVQLCTQSTAGLGTTALAVSAGDEIIFMYYDMAPAMLVSAVTRVVASMTGILTVSPIHAVPGQTILLSVNDSDANTDSLSIDKVSVEVTSCNRTLKVVLFETGVNTGQFSGFLQTGFIGSINNSPSVSVLTCSFGGIITSVYADLLPVLKNISLSTKFASLSLLSVSEIRENGKFVINVTDNDSLDANFVMVTIGVLGTVNTTSKNINLFRISNLPIFTATLNTSGLYSNGNDFIFAPAGSSVYVKYRNPQSPSLEFNSTTIVLSSFLGILKLLPSPIQVGVVLTIRLEDQDLDTNLTVQNAYVAVFSNLSKCLDPIKLTESDVNSGVFTAELSTLDGDSYWTQGTDMLYVSQGDLLTVQYQDTAPYLLVNGYNLVVASYVGILSLSPDSFLVGGILYVTVQDDDLNLLPNIAESCQTTVLLNTIEAGILSLKENNVNSGVFTGSIESSLTTQENATLSSMLLDVLENYQPMLRMLFRPGDALTVVYVDKAPIQTSVKSVTVMDSHVGISDIGVSMGQLQYSPSILLRAANLGDSIPITVIDSDLNQDETVVESAVAYGASSIGEIIKVSLTEINQNSSVFSGVVGTADSSSNTSEQFAPPDFLTGTEGSTITCIYYDQAPRLQIRSQSIVRFRMQASLQASFPYIRAGEMLTLTLVDSDLDLSVAVQTSNVTVNSFADSEIMTLTETSGTSGTFTGTIPTTFLFSAAIPDSGWLDVVPDSSIAASYFDSGSGTTTSVEVNVLLSQIGSLSTAPAQVTQNAGSMYGSVSITVSDLDWDYGPYSLDECSVWIVPYSPSGTANGLFQEAVIGINLVETISKGGVFTAEIMVISDAFVRESQVIQRYCIGGPRDWGPCIDDLECGGPGTCDRTLYTSSSNVALVAGESYYILYKDLRPEGTSILSSTLNVHSPGVIEISPQVLVLGQSLLITVRDLGDSGSERFSVSAYNSAVPDQYVAVYVVETGAFTGVFTGTLLTTAGQGPNMTSLGVKEGDVITVISGKSGSDRQNLSATVLVATTARIQVSPSTIRANGVWSITVIDMDQSINSSSVVSLYSIDEMAGTYSTAITISLMQTSVESARFTGKLLNSDQGVFGIEQKSSSDLAILHGVQVLNIINITCHDYFPNVVVWTALKILNSALGIIYLNSSSLDGQMLSVAILDRDQDQNYTRVDYISASFRSTMTGDNESLTLVETGYHTGSFTGQMPTKLNLSSQVKDDGLLGTGSHDSVICQYLDPAPAASLESITRFAPSHLGILTIVPPHFAVGDLVTMIVSDPDDPEIVQVSINVTQVAVPIVVTLNSSGRGSFIGLLNTSFSVPGGSEFVFSYQDFAPYVLIKQIVRSCYLGSISAVPINVAIGFDAEILLTDNDLINVENITCTVQSMNAKTSIIAVLDEMNSNGSFTGTLHTTNSSHKTASNQIFDVSAGDHLKLLYYDSCPAAVVTAFVNVRFAGTVELSPLDIRAGGRLHIVVNDEDVQGQVTVNCTSGAASAGVVLSETGQDTGIFSDYFDTLTIPDFCRPGFEIYCSYFDEEPQNTATKAVLVNPSMLGVLVSDLTTVLEGGVIALSLNDSDILTTSQTIFARTRFGIWPISLLRVNSSSDFVGDLYTVANLSYVPGTINQIPVVAGDTVFLEYEDSAPFTNVTLQVDVVQSAVGNPQIFPDPVSTNSVVYAIVVDADLNTNPNISEQIGITVTVLGGGGLVSLNLVLFEDGLSSDTFQGEFRTQQVGGTSPNGTLAVSAGQSIELLYYDKAPLGVRSATVLVVPTQPAFFSVVPKPALPGTPLQVTLVNSGINSESVTVSVVSVATDLGLLAVGAVGSVQLISSNNSGNFSATLYPMLPDMATVARNSNSMVNVIDVFYGDVIKFSFLDFTPLSYIIYRHKVAAIGVLNVTSVLKKDGEVLVSLNDSDINTNSLLIQSTSIPVRDENSNASILLNLTETGPDASLFTGLLRIHSTRSNISSGVLAPVQVSDNVSLTYVNALPPGISTIYLVVGPSYPGNLTVSTRRINMGDDVTISLVDADLITSQFVIETEQIPVTSTRSPSVERSKFVVLSETQVNSSGSFSGILRTTYGDLNGMLNNSDFDVSEGDILTVSYHDTAPSATYVIPIKVAKLGSISISPTVINVYGVLTLTVNDFDLNLFATIAEVWSNSVVVYDGASSVPVIIVETGLDTSVFTAVVPSTPTTTTQQGYLQRVSAGSIISAVYMDLYPGFGSAVPVTTQAIVATNGTVSINPEPVITDAFISITVIDEDVGWNAGLPDNITVQTMCICTTQFLNVGGNPQCTYNSANPRVIGSVNVALQETGLATGDFTGVVWLYSLTNKSNSSISLNAPSGSVIQVVYDDVHPSPVVQRISQQKVATIGIVTVSPAPVNENTAVTITVTDPDMDISDNSDTNWYDLNHSICVCRASDLSCDFLQRRIRSRGSDEF